MDERAVAARVSHLVKKFVEHIKTKKGMGQSAAAAWVDGEYVRGYVMFLVPESTNTTEDMTVTAK